MSRSHPSTARSETVVPPPTGSVSSTRSTSTTRPPVSCVDRTLSALTRAQLIGQVLMIGVPADDPLAVREQIGDTPLGGIFLADRTSRAAAALAADIAEWQRAAARFSGVPLHVSIDQEGGYVQTLTGEDFPAIPTPVQQGTLGATELTGLTRTWAGRLADIGITLDLSPVADTVPAGTEQDNPPVGANDRQFGSDPTQVAQDTGTVVRAMRAVGLGSTVKHFPGLGRVTANTDTATGAVDDRTTADDPFLEPFRAGIAAGTDAVMISSASYPALDPAAIAVFSHPIITGLLRGSLGFTGLIVSDDLGNAAAVKDLTAGERAVAFLRAGGDLVLTVRTDDLQPMTEALTTEVTNDPAFARTVETAARRVLQSKARLGVLNCRTR